MLAGGGGADLVVDCALLPPMSRHELRDSRSLLLALSDTTRAPSASEFVAPLPTIGQATGEDRPSQAGQPPCPQWEALPLQATEPSCGASHPRPHSGWQPRAPARGRSSSDFLWLNQAPLPPVLPMRPPAFRDTPEAVRDRSRFTLRKQHGPQFPPVFNGGWTQ